MASLPMNLAGEFGFIRVHCVHSRLKYQNEVALAPKPKQVDKVNGFVNFMGMNRLTIEIEPEQHRQIKTLATFAGMTIKEFVLAKTLDVPAKKRQPLEADTTDKLLGSVTNAKRLRKAISSQTPEHLVFESVEDLKNALGI
jgi:hypothetical protein